MRTSAHQHRDEDALWGSTLAGSRDGQAECDWHAGLTPGPGVRGRLDSTFPLRRISDRSETGDWRLADGLQQLLLMSWGV